ncbi:hypothetical protein [Actinoplanes sp. URMC 104]|uniref:hypothetical protein n=1 Tax=Actinoplanes sp. URMC 104 TaxID=3423409 RepID=UPI003F1D749F
MHGTGVREKRYADLFRLVRRKAAKHWPGVTVLPCFWGDVLGVPLDAAAATVPDYDIARGGALPVDEWRDERWILLEADPLYELRLLTAAYEDTGDNGLPGAGLTARDRLDTYLGWAAALDRRPRVVEMLTGLDLTPPVLTAAVRTVFDAPVAREAIELIASSDGEGELREALARAVVAALLVAADAGLPGSFPADAIGRDMLTSAVIDGLDGGDLGAGQTLLRISAELVLRMGVAKAVERRRGLIMDRATPFGGDVLRYLAHGEPVRRYIAKTVQSVTGPVVLVSHSLGGIASLDLLRFGLAEVDLLVTVGSQGSYLGSLGALPSESADAAPLPAWVNVYDPRDLLAYLAAPVFGAAVEDLPVRSGAPFPRAHSAYFSLDEFYTELWDRFPR